MPNKYTFSKRADKEISKILEYSYREFGLGLDQAEKYKTGLENCFQLLGDDPGMGRICNDIRNEYFRHEHESHIIFYRQRSDDIFITAIIHDRMDIKNIFGISGNS